MPAHINTSLTWWEVFRLWLAGGEYAEMRVPELIAAAITNHQDDNALIGVMSDWLRTNLVDENRKALVFGIARILKYRGGRFLTATAYALEALPAITNELQERPEMQNGTAEERRMRLQAAVADRFTTTFQAAKNRLSHIPITLGGLVADSSSSSSSTSGGWFSGWGERLSNLFAGAGSVAGRIAEIGLVISGYVIAGIGVCVAYLIACVAIGWNYQQSMDGFAWSSFYILTGVPVALMILGLFLGNVGRIIQLASLAGLMYLSSALIVISFAVAAVTGIIVNNDAWGTIVMLMVVATVWDRVVWGLTQKFLGLPGFFLKFLPRFLNDFTIDEADAIALADYWRNSNAIEKITILVAGAINGGVLVITLFKMWQHPLPFLQAVGLIALELALGAAYIRMSIKLSGENDYPTWLGLKDVIKKWMARLYRSSMTSTVAIPIVILLILAFAGLVSGSTVHSWWSKSREASISGAERTAKIVETAASKSLDYAEEKVGVPKTQTTAPASSAQAQAPKPKGKTKAQKKAEALEAYGGREQCEKAGDISFPCN